jgi:pyruvate dehydrogenase E2 component (dihydrolipoamide acetyltransferase)
MPALSPTMSQGNLAKWHVKPGDEVKPGTVLADVETDKATLAFENQEEGFVAKLLVEDGARDIPVGKPVAILVEDPGSISAFAKYPGNGAPAASAPAAPPASASTAPAHATPVEASKAYPPHTVSLLAVVVTVVTCRSRSVSMTAKADQSISTHCAYVSRSALNDVSLRPFA